MLAKLHQGRLSLVAGQSSVKSLRANIFVATKAK